MGCEKPAQLSGEDIRILMLIAEKQEIFDAAYAMFRRMNSLLAEADTTPLHKRRYKRYARLTRRALRAVDEWRDVGRPTIQDAFTSDYWPVMKEMFRRKEHEFGESHEEY